MRERKRQGCDVARQTRPRPTPLRAGHDSPLDLDAHPRTEGPVRNEARWVPGSAQLQWGRGALFWGSLSPISLGRRSKAQHSCARNRGTLSPHVGGCMLAVRSRPVVSSRHPFWRPPPPSFLLLWLGAVPIFVFHLFFLLFFLFSFSFAYVSLPPPSVCSSSPPRPN